MCIRDRSNREWLNADQAIACSLALFEEHIKISHTLIPLVAGFAFVKVFQDIDLTLKWPNDIIFNEKKVFIHNINGIIEYPHWREKFDNWIDDKRIRTSYKLSIKSNEIAQVYSFFRKKPFDRYMGRDSLHRMTVSTWENIRTHQFAKIAANIATCLLYTSPSPRD